MDTDNATPLSPVADLYDVDEWLARTARRWADVGGLSEGRIRILDNIARIQSATEWRLDD